VRPATTPFFRVWANSFTGWLHSFSEEGLIKACFHQQGRLADKVHHLSARAVQNRLGRVCCPAQTARIPHDDHATAALLVNGQDGTLSQKVSRQMANPGRKTYSNAQAIRWALDVATALEYLHMRSPAIFHRDVKLTNILCTKDECGQSVAKLSDFGLHVVSAVSH